MAQQYNKCIQMWDIALQLQEIKFQLSAIKMHIKWQLSEIKMQLKVWQLQNRTVKSQDIIHTGRFKVATMGNKEVIAYFY